MRKSTLLFLFLGMQTVLLAAALMHAAIRRESDAAALQASAEMTARLGLTDLCLFTEARYTRNPTQADRFAPFQDHPLSLEHFPSGSLLGPQGLRGGP